MRYTNMVVLTITYGMLLACSNPQKKGVVEENVPDSVYHKTEVTLPEDTIIHEIPYYTAELENWKEYFRENNQYKDWSKNDRKTTLIQCIVEKDSITKNVKVLGKGSGNRKLDDEAIRLISEAKVPPAMDGNKKPVRSVFSILVFFPPQ